MGPPPALCALPRTQRRPAPRAPLAPPAPLTPARPAPPPILKHPQPLKKVAKKLGFDNVDALAADLASSASPNRALMERVRLNNRGGGQTGRGAVD
jgi:hypothetical protein